MNTVKNKPEDIHRVLTLADERAITNFSLGYFDHNGRLRAKYYSRDSLEKAMTDGLALNLGIFAATHNETPMENSRFLDGENQFRDAGLLLLADTCRDFPLDGEKLNLILLGELVDEHRVYCPRALLSKELERYRQMGLLTLGAFEFEWTMLEESRASIRDKTPQSLTVCPGFELFYSFVDQLVDNPLYREVIDTCHTMGMPVETLHSEYTGLMEGALRPAQGGAIADNAGLFKWVVKAIAARRGLMASFMARRNSVDHGCGAHINLSLQDGAGKPVFHDAGAKHSLSGIMCWFLGGLLRYTPELFLLQAPNFNSYRRFQPGLFTPLSNTWGINNKTVAFRAVNVNPGATRIELRLPGADTHPHLALLGMLVAGRKGIEERIQPGDPVTGDGWVAPDASGNAFPVDFPSAIARFNKSALAREVLGDAFVDCYVASRQWQLDELAATVTDWEIRTFLEGA